MNYRDLARKHIKHAMNELNSKSELRLKYAALELRMAMESLTYDRALAYKDEFPPSEYETWQPRKVMSVLLDIDPKADKDCSLAVREEGKDDAPYVSLGAEKVLNMIMLKKHYDALGSYLHVQSMKQFRAGIPVDNSKIRIRCMDIADFVSQVLSSPIFNVTVGEFASTDCVKCGNPIRKRLPDGEKETLATCHECNATYTVTGDGNDKTIWTPHQREVKCVNPNCGQKDYLWPNEIERGNTWICGACGGKNTFVLAIVYQEPEKSG